MEIEGRAFLVAGGGSGLGAATARMLADAGADVVVADLKQQGSPPNVRFVETDVTSEEAVKNAVEEASQGDRLYGVVNCAGIAPPEKVVGRRGPHALESFARVVQVNLVGSFNVARLAAAVMRENEPAATAERGVIVNTASIAAFDGQIGQAAYAASKGGVAAMTLPIARELAALRIRVVTIAPGIFDTPMVAGLPEEAQRSLGEQVPFPKRLGRPEEYAALVRHIVENPMLNGEVIRLDGAIRMGPR